MSKYSIIISYRDRKDHLEILIPSLCDIFKNKEYEIIISEQNDNFKFNKSILYNIGYQRSSGDILVFHDVDHIPSQNVNYFKLEADNLDVWYPVKNVIYTNLNIEKLPDENIPAGYRTHQHGVHDDHFGGVFICKRHVFGNVNGMCPLYVGWGKEDEDIRDRFLYYKYKIIRADDGTFAALQHLDNCPHTSDDSFINNHSIKKNMIRYLNIGIYNSQADITEFDCGIPNVKWIKSTNYKII